MNSVGRTLNYGEEKFIKQKIQDLEDTIQGRELVGTQGVHLTANNIVKVRRQVDELKTVLKTQGVREISEKERVEMEKECRMIEEKIRNGFPGYAMPSWDRYVGSRPKDGPRHDRLVDWCTWFNSNSVVQNLVKRWKSLRRHLDPMNPKSSHVMYLFPE